MEHTDSSIRSVSRVAASIIVVVVIVAAVVSIFIVLPNLTKSTTGQKASFMLDFSPQCFHALFYYGYDHGFYTDNGLNVTIMPGSGSLNTIAAVATGKVDFGWADTGTLAQEAMTSNISNVRIVAMVYHVTPFVLLYNNATIHSFSDLNGKTLGSNQGSGSLVLFRILAKNYGLNMSSIQIKYASPSVYPELVVTGQVDFIATTIDKVPLLTPLAEKQGISLNFFRYADYGLDIYGNAIITTTQMIQKSTSDLTRISQLFSHIYTYFLQSKLGDEASELYVGIAIHY